jgi:hypothetical protein
MVSGNTLRFFRPQVSQDFFIIGETASAKTPFVNEHGTYDTADAQGVLVGVILAIPEERNKNIKPKRKALLKALIDEIEDEYTPADGLTASLSETVADARLEGVGVFQLRFALFRTGELRIWFGLKDMLDREVHSGAVPPSPEEMELAKALPSQAYYFVKDAAHLHYHHEPDSDQILPLTRLVKPTTPEEHNENELSWRREALWGLARVVSQFRRNNDLYDFKKAQGVLAYADAFQSTLARVMRPETLEGDSVEHKDLTLYDFAHTRTSVEAMESLASWRRSGWIQLFATMIGVILSCLALWAGAVQIRPIICAGIPKGELQCPEVARSSTVDVILWVSNHPLVFTGTIFILSVAVFVLILRDLTFVPLGRQFKRLLSPLAKAIGVTLARRTSDVAGYALSIFFLTSLFVLSFIAAFRFAMYMIQH